MMFGLSEDVIQDLHSFFSKYEGIDKIEIFGSRARGDNAKKSDIDLCLYSQEMSDKEFSSFRYELINELPILYKIDCVHFEKINDKLKKNILRDGKLFFIKILPFDKFFKNTTPKPYQIEKKDYLESGKYPVVDQGKKFIVGYSNQEKKLFKLENPIIIFGDHTRIIKYIDFDFIIGADGTKILFPYDDKINSKYAYYQLLHTKIENLGYSRHYKILKEKTFQKPSLTKQKQIAKILDKAQELIELRKESIDKLDALAKSIFIDMFGDPVRNPMGWEVKKLNELSTHILSGNTPKGGSQVYVENGIHFFRSQNVWKNRIVIKDIVYIDNKTHLKMKKSSLEHKDILITKTGRINTENSSLGRAALFLGKDNSANINGHVYLVRLKKSMVHEFILYILTTNEYREYIRSICVGGIDKRQINKAHLEEFPIIFPAIELQNKFAKTIQKLEQQKSLYQEELTKLQENFDALLAESFKG